MQEIICFIKEFEGIIGAVFGAIATLITTEILKSVGKLKIYVMDSKGVFNYNVTGCIVEWRESKEDKLCGYNHNIILNLYNSSDSPKFIRDLKLNIYNEEKLLFIKEMKDESTRTITQGILRISKADNAKIYNIEPKIAIELNLSFYIKAEEYKKIKNNKKVRFEISYINDKNKVIKMDVFNDYLKEPKIRNKK